MHCLGSVLKGNHYIPSRLGHFIPLHGHFITADSYSNPFLYGFFFYIIALQFGEEGITCSDLHEPINIHPVIFGSSLHRHDTVSSTKLNIYRIEIEVKGSGIKTPVGLPSRPFPRERSTNTII